MSQDPAATRAQFDQIVEALSHQKIVSYFDVFSATILCYDVIANLEIEFRHIWKRKWSIVTTLYIVQRYSPFFDVTGLTFHHQFGKDLSPDYCSLNYHIVGWSISFNLLISEALLTLRVWAVWRGNIKVGIGLVVFFLGCWLYDLDMVARFLDSMEFQSLPFPSLRGCFITGGSNILSFTWMCVMIYDVAMLLMMLIPGIRAYREGNMSELVRAIYQDGATYYVLIFLLSMVNVIVIRTLPADFLPILSSFERIIHSVLTSHVVLHIRQLAGKNRAQGSAYQMTSLNDPAPLSSSQHRTTQSQSIWDLD